MSLALYTEQYVQDIADAIREVTRSESTYMISEMATAIKDIATEESVEIDELITRTITSITNDRVVAIAAHALRDSPSLISVEFSLAQSVAGSAFYNCAALETCIFPSLISITANAFIYCTNLIKFVLSGDQVCALANANAFSSTAIANGTGYIYVPDNLVATYQSAANWSTYAAQIRPISQSS